MSSEYLTKGAPGISTELRKVTVQGITNTACRLSYSTITDDVLCVSTTGGKGTCNVILNIV